MKFSNFKHGRDEHLEVSNNNNSGSPVRKLS